MVGTVVVVMVRTAGTDTGAVTGTAMGTAGAARRRRRRRTSARHAHNVVHRTHRERFFAADAERRWHRWLAANAARRYRQVQNSAPSAAVLPPDCPTGFAPIAGRVPSYIDLAAGRNYFAKSARRGSCRCPRMIVAGCR